MLQVAGNSAAARPTAVAAEAAPDMSASVQAADDPNAQQRKNAMVGRANEGSDVNPHRLTAPVRSEEHTSELQSLMRISYAVFCLKKKKKHRNTDRHVHSKRK